MMIAIAVAVVIAAYLVGSVNFAVIFTRLFTKRDIRDFGSGNAGATNVIRVGGIMPGLLTFVCDALKSFGACMAGRLAFGYISEQTGAVWAAPVYGAYICGLVCMLGHVFPLFFQFRGGKGVATSVGIYAVCCPAALVIGLSAFAIIVLCSRTVSLSSLIASAIAVAVSMIFHTRSALFWPQAVMSLALLITVVLRHTENIRRLLAGEEKQLNIGRNKADK